MSMYISHHGMLRLTIGGVSRLFVPKFSADAFDEDSESGEVVDVDKKTLTFARYDRRGIPLKEVPLIPRKLFEAIH